ncbi:type IIL restriction-modification enzyme MmeI [Corynebacterium testudinoris]|nr:type IIL restriction-modification enzyme MmeI [Corynebacterium testudinoris]
MVLFSEHWLQEIKRWKNEGSINSAERSSGQRFWLDFLGCFGFDALKMDIFEHQAFRPVAQTPGRIDVRMGSLFIGETKSPPVNIKRADIQLIDYRAGFSDLDPTAPMYGISTNFKTFHIFNFDSSRSHPILGVDLDDLPQNLSYFKFLCRPVPQRPVPKLPEPVTPFSNSLDIQNDISYLLGHMPGDIRGIKIYRRRQEALAGYLPLYKNAVAGGCKESFRDWALKRGFSQTLEDELKKDKDLRSQTNMGIWMFAGMLMFVILIIILATR